MGHVRLSLALLIMVAHLGPPMAAGYFPHVAVLGFYGLSGYTATASMSTRYQGRPWAFMVSRWWRLWPSYLAVFSLSLLWLMMWPGWGSFAWPLSALDRIAQLLMLVRPETLRIVPTAWVLPWFLLGYAVIAYGQLHRPRHCGIALGLIILLAQWAGFKASFTTYYYSPIFALLGIVGGAAVWHLYGSIPRDGRWGQWAGAISYPMFLCHYWVGAVFQWPPGWPLFFAALPPTLALSWLLVVAVERPVQKFRSSIL
jgi:peptidoglycan/LPS O-acetylase OafA/YrhL